MQTSVSWRRRAETKMFTRVLWYAEEEGKEGAGHAWSGCLGEEVGMVKVKWLLR